MTLKDNWGTGDTYNADDMNALTTQVNENTAAVNAMATPSEVGSALVSAADEQAAREAIAASGQIYNNVKDYGAVGDGVTDDTDAIEAAYLAAGYYGAIYFPAGNFLYNGTGLDSASGHRIVVAGAGNGATRISLGDSSYFIKYTRILPTLQMRDIYFVGGKGAINHTHTGFNVSGMYVVENCHFRNYTECAIQSESADMPYWSIRDCIFFAANQTDTIGVALGRGMDNCVIDSCFFRLNRIHIKARRGNNFKINNCELNFWSNDNSGGPRVAIWIVPSSVYVGSGQGMTITNGRWGNEGLEDGDFRVLIADEDGGASNGSKMPVLDADSTGYFSGLNLTNSIISGTSGAQNSIIYSTTPYIRHVQVHHNMIYSTLPNYVLQFRTPPTAPDRLSSTNIFGPFTGDISTEHISFPASNAEGVGYWQDPTGVLQSSNTIRPWSSGASASYIQNLSVSIASFAVTAPATKSTITDAYGGSDAILWTLGSTSQMQLRSGLSAFVVGLPVWVEFDVQNTDDGVTSGDSLKATVWDNNGGAVHWQRFVRVPSVAQGWVTYAFSFIPRTVGSTPYIYFGPTETSSTGNTINLGRVRVYQANERQIGGQRPAIAAEATDAAETMALANDLRTKLIELGIIKA